MYVVPSVFVYFPKGTGGEVKCEEWGRDLRRDWKMGQ